MGTMSAIKLLAFVFLAAGVLYLIFKNSKNSLFLLVATFPMFNVETLDIGGGFFVLSPNKIFGALVVVLMVVDVISKGKEFRFTSPQMLLSLLLLVLMLISFMVNGARHLTWAQRNLSNLFFLLAMVTWIETREEADLGRLVFIVSLAFFTIPGLFGFQEQAVAGPNDRARFMASMLNANRAAHTYIMGAGLALAWLLRGAEKPWRRWSGFALLGLFAYATMATGSRAGLIALVVTLSGAPILLWQRPGARILIVPMVLGAIALLVFMPQVMADRAQQIPSLKEGLSKEEARSRIHQYRLALQLIDDSPIVGIGPHEFNRIYSQRVEGDTPRSLHSWYLKVAVDAGIPALTVFVLLLLVSLGVAMRGALRSSDPGLRGEGWSNAFLVIGMMVFGIVSSVPYSKLNWLIFAFAAVELNLQQRDREKLQKDTAQAYLDRADELPATSSTVVVIKK